MHRKVTAPIDRSRNRGVSGSPSQCDLIDQTIEVWQRRAHRQLTREDGREIIENMTGFFKILQEWRRAEQRRRKRRQRQAEESS